MALQKGRFGHGLLHLILVGDEDASTDDSGALTKVWAVIWALELDDMDANPAAVMIETLDDDEVVWEVGEDGAEGEEADGEAERAAEAEAYLRWERGLAEGSPTDSMYFLFLRKSPYMYS